MVASPTTTTNNCNAPHRVLCPHPSVQFELPATLAGAQRAAWTYTRTSAPTTTTIRQSVHTYICLASRLYWAWSPTHVTVTNDDNDNNNNGGGGGGSGGGGDEEVEETTTASTYPPCVDTIQVTPPIKWSQVSSLAFFRSANCNHSLMTRNSARRRTTRKSDNDNTDQR